MEVRQGIRRFIIIFGRPEPFADIVVPRQLLSPLVRSRCRLLSAIERPLNGLWP